MRMFVAFRERKVLYDGKKKKGMWMLIDIVERVVLIDDFEE